MKKLTYKKIVNSAIEINLYNDFSVIAVVMTNNDKSVNTVTFYLKANNANIIIPISDLNEVIFEVEQNRLYPEILKYTSTLLNNNTLQEYIDKYNQEIIHYFYDFHKTLDVEDN